MATGGKRWLGALVLSAGMVSARVARAEETDVNTVFGDAVAAWHLAGEADAGGRLPLRVRGDVSLGVALNGVERDASRVRGGDGVAARFDGGYLELVGGESFRLGETAFTLAVRLRDTEGAWAHPILGSYGSDREVSLALRGVDGRTKPFVDRNLGGGEVTTVESWLFRPGGPRSLTGSSAMLEACWGAREANPARVALIRDLQAEASWPNPLEQDTRNAVMRVGFPVALIGPTDWHDVVVRFTGPKLQLFIDGVLVDEEYPVGVTRGRTIPFLIGAGHENGALRTGFRGFVDHVAVWDRPLSDAEVAVLCGGDQAVRVREAAILGAESPSMQYFRPRGHNRKAGDCIPFWDPHTDTFRLFYLILRRNMHSKWDGGHGGLEIFQATTRDLATWEHHPVTIPVTEQWEAWNGTGGVAYHAGRYHWFYPTPCYDDPPACGGIQHAVSDDGIRFAKTEPHPFLPGGDCEVYEDADGLFHMLKAGPSRTVNTPPLRDKTLVAWVRVADLEQGGGSVLTLEHPDRIRFDAIVYAERAPHRWMPGSDNFQRTPGDQGEWPEETAAPDRLVQMALVHAGTAMRMYRDGTLYAAAEIDKPVEFPPGSSVLIGLRHTGATGRMRSHFRGAVADARVYNRALDPGELAALRPHAKGGPEPIAWFDFAEGGLRDRMGNFPDGTLRGAARIENGELHVDEGGTFHAPGATATLTRLTSPDLLTWTPADVPFIETDVMNVAMCPHLFRFGDWFYFIGGNAWWRSKGEFGPWTPHEPARIDGLQVPKTGAFGAGRRIYAGFLEDGGWGGNLVLRELVQDEDGWLGTRFVPEMIPAAGPPIDLRLPGEASAAGTTLHLRATGEGRTATVAGIPADFRLELTVAPEPGVRTVTVSLREDANGEGGCDLVLDLASRSVRFSVMDDSGGRRHGGPGIAAVRGLDREFRLHVVARHDILDAEIGDFRSLTTRCWNPSGDRIRFAADGPVTLHGLTIRPLAAPPTP